MTKAIFACLFSLLLNHLTAKKCLVDSITKELQQPMADSIRAMSMMRLAIDYELVDTARAYMAYRYAIKFAREKKLHYQLGRIYQNQSVLFTTSANYALSRISLDSAVVNYHRSNHPKAKKFIAIYRIVQQLINNTMKHAAAKTALVQVTKAAGQLAITVEDDGTGFDTALLNRGKSIGWSNIQNRVEFLNGTLDVQSAKEKGTSVHIELTV